MERLQDNRTALQKLTKSKLVIVTVYAMFLSFFYNLPVVTYSAVGNNELRLYDLAGLALVYLYITNYNLINAIINYRAPFKNLFQFLQWCNVTMLFTIGYSIYSDKYFWIFQSLLYLFHFWIFFLGAVFLVVIIQDLKQFKRLVTWSLICASVVFFIVILQNFQVIPFLWNQSYYDNYHGFLSGTVGPNKIVIGITTLIVFALAIGLLNDKRVTINVVILLITIALSTIVLIMSGSRTAYVGFAVFVLYFSIRETKSFIFSGIVLFFVIIGVSYLNPEILTKATDVYEGRVVNKIKNPNELQDGNVDGLYEDLGAGRETILFKYLDLLTNDLIFVPLGKGFNNRIDTMSSAHNIYLSLIYEVGIVGMVLYCRWLWSFMLVKMHNFPQLRMSLKGLALAMIVTLFFGEHLYVYRALFGLVGLFLFVTTILCSPIFMLDPGVKNKS